MWLVVEDVDDVCVLFFDFVVICDFVDYFVVV